MEMTQIRYVLAAAKHLNFTRAAEECNVSQPALTKGIKSLEDELGAPVFHREGRRILLSEFGRTMVPHLRHIVDEAEAAQMLAQSFRLLEKAPLRLGVMSTIGHARLARFLAGFGKANPGVELAVTEMALADLVAAVDEGRLDAAVLTLMPDVAERFHTEPLYSERYIVVCPPGSPLERMNAVTLADVSGADYVDRLACEMREMVMAVCGEREISLYARFRSEREDWVQAMVHAGLGFAFMPEYSVTLPGLVQRPLTEPEVTRQVALVTPRGRPHTPAMAALVRASRSFAWPG